MIRTLAITLGFILLTLVSCKKESCVICENSCHYVPTLTNDTICSNDFQHKNMYDSAIDFLINEGHDCIPIDPSVSFEECEEEKIELFENQYYCNEK